MLCCVLCFGARNCQASSRPLAASFTLAVASMHAQVLTSISGVSHLPCAAKGLAFTNSELDKSSLQSLRKHSSAQILMYVRFLAS